MFAMAEVLGPRIDNDANFLRSVLYLSSIAPRYCSCTLLVYPYECKKAIIALFNSDVCKLNVENAVG